MEPYETIAKSIIKRGITKAELARRTKINDELLRRSLIGKRKLPAPEFIALCRELDLF